MFDSYLNFGIGPFTSNESPTCTFNFNLLQKYALRACS